MPYTIPPLIRPKEQLGKNVSHFESDSYPGFSIIDFFQRISTTSPLRTVDSMAQLDKLPDNVNLLAAFHCVKPQHPMAGTFSLLILVIMLCVGVLGLPLLALYGEVWFGSLDPTIAQIVGFGGLAMIVIIGLFIFTEVRAEKVKPNEPKVPVRARQWYKQGGVRLGMGWIVVDKPKYALGDTIRFIYSQKVVKPTQIRGGVVRFVLLEASKERVSSQQNHYQDYVELDRVDIPAGSYRADERLQVRGQFTLPEHAPSVLITPNHRMVYMLVVTLDVAEQTTTELLYHLPVQPSVVVDEVEFFI